MLKDVTAKEKVGDLVPRGMEAFANLIGGARDTAGGMDPLAGAMGGTTSAPGEPVGLSSGNPPSQKRGNLDPWAVPDEAEMLKAGEANVKAFVAFCSRLRSEGVDVRCGLRVLGEVSAVCPRFAEALAEHGVPATHVEGAWVVPPFVLKDLQPHPRWREARGRLGPFLKNDVWARVGSEVRQGRVIGWEKMGLQPANLVCVKYYVPWAATAAAARSQITWGGARRAVSAVRSLATRHNLRHGAVALWPYRWSWLVAWVVRLPPPPAPPGPPYPPPEPGC